MLRFRLVLATLAACSFLSRPVSAQESEDPPVPEWARTPPPPIEPAPAQEEAAQAEAPPEAAEELVTGGVEGSVEGVEERPRTIPATTDWPLPMRAHTFRGLPPCAPGQPIPNSGTGENYTCHPPFRDPGLEVVTHLVMGPGVGIDEANTDRAFTGGFDLSLFPARWFGFGAEWLAVRTRMTGHDLDADGVIDGQAPHMRLHHLTGRLLLRGYLDDSSRRSIGVFAQGGYAISLTDRVPSMPVVGGGLTLGAGTLSTGNNAADFELGVRYLQGLGDEGRSRYRSVLVTMGVGLASRYHAPRDFSEPAPNGLFRFALSLGLTRQVRRGALFSGEMGLGLDVHRVLEPRIRVELGALGLSKDSRADDRAPFSRVALGSLGLRAYAPLRVRIFGEVGAGVLGVFGDTPRVLDPGAFVDVRFGVPFVSCSLGVNLSVRYRAGVSGGYRGEHSIGAAFEFSYGEYAHMTGTCGGTVPGSNPEPPPPPPPPAPEPEPEPPVSEPVDARVDVEIEIPQVEIEVHPVSVEVVIGYVLFGGAVDMRLNVASLPLSQLRSAGWIEVTVVGPPAARARAHAELDAVLDREGIHVDARAEAAAEGSVQAVKAIFTIWPPGTRP